MALAIGSVVGALGVVGAMVPFSRDLRTEHERELRAMQAHIDEVQAELRSAQARPSEGPRPFAPRGQRVVEGRVLRSSGPTAQVGESCRVEVSWGIPDYERACRVLARCGERWIYGGVGLGYVACRIGDGLDYASDEEASSVDGSPILEMAAGLETLRVLDHDPEWSITIDLVPGP